MAKYEELNKDIRMTMIGKSYDQKQTNSMTMKDINAHRAQRVKF